MKRLAIALLMAMTAFVGDTFAQDTASRVSIMAFNVENFFDNADDPRIGLPPEKWSFLKYGC